jgi:glycerol kinase
LKKYIAAIDQGTSSTRCIIFDHQGRAVCSHQIEHQQILPRPGWVEHDPLEIWQSVQTAVTKALQKGHISPSAIAGVGIANQRETVVVWNRSTGIPYYNAIVWQCTRTQDICDQLISDGGVDRFHSSVGLPVAAYFSATKIKWILEHVPGVKAAASRGEALFGNIDSWIIWWLTGGPDGGVHVTDVTNASRTMLMDLRSLSWSLEIASVLDIPVGMLPRIRPSSDPEIYGFTRQTGPFGFEIPICAAIGDQQAALAGQSCFNVGDTKNTYGTGCFILTNTGSQPVYSRRGLLTTLAYRLGKSPPVYCLEGSVAVAGALVQWLRDNLKLIQKSSDIEALAKTVQDNGDSYFVPAFSGLFAPYWKSDARGVIAGLTMHTNAGHLARAALEACAYQTRDIIDVIQEESGSPLSSLKVDGGMVENQLLMQFQADILGIRVVRSRIAEATALGAAYMAGLAFGFWQDLDQLGGFWQPQQIWDPLMDASTRENLYQNWKKAVARSYNWIQ